MVGAGLMRGIIVLHGVWHVACRVRWSAWNMAREPRKRMCRTAERVEGKVDGPRPSTIDNTKSTWLALVKN